MEITPVKQLTENQKGLDSKIKIAVKYIQVTGSNLNCMATEERLLTMESLLKDTIYMVIPRDMENGYKKMLYHIMENFKSLKKVLE